MAGATASTSSTAHIRKRQFQPSIESYFGRHDSDGDTTSRLARAISPLSPPVPESTQSSLLSVGMRVRKSVPEGYKTHKTLVASQGFQVPSTAPSNTSNNSSFYRTTGTRATTTELMPFCGLHKVGGWGVQDIPPSSAPAIMQAADFGSFEDGGDMPGLSSSQNTLPSSSGSFMAGVPATSTASRKRTYDEETEDDLDEYFNGLDAMEPLPQSMVSADRPIARVRTQTSKALPGQGIQVVVADGDFEDASFLAPMELDGDADGT